ncbi:MAG TPA: tetratricopeptide repeat protein, partial [Bdellovibrionales bacterium]|nr:tetratricopeptide repeat protein [Bdellovibrionales bacterium]
IALLRTSESGRIVRISLIETAPDSSIFSGLYSIGFKDSDQLQAQFFIPPQDLAVSEAGLQKITAQILANKLKRKPFILRRSKDGQQTAEVFDTKEQARQAAKAYRLEQQTIVQNSQAKKFPSDSEVATAELAEELRRKEIEAKAMSERARLEQLEAKRLETLRAEQAKLGAAEKERRRQQSKVLGDEALALFKQEKYREAKEKFAEALNLNPENRILYFQYGVTLYKLDDFDRAIAMFRLADDPTVNQVERNYFTGLAHFRLKEFAQANEAFDKVVASKDEVLSPSARFYQGMGLFEQRNWEPAQKAFQDVLDTSKDPNLDARAENQVELILRYRQFEEEAKRRWLLLLTIGEMYDSNVLLTSTSTNTSPSDMAGYRTLLSGSAKYRPVYTETREFAAQLDLLTMYTVDTSFQTTESFRNADPNVATLTFPWTYKGMVFGKGYKLDVIPGYETTYMSIEDNTTKEILASFYAGFNNLFVMNETWFATYGIELRSDDSKTRVTSSEDDADAFKVKFSNSNLLIVSEDKTKILIPEAALTLNQARGGNVAYNRVDIGLGYIIPSFWQTTANFKLAYYLQDYPAHNLGRVDNSYTGTAGLTKKLSDTWSSGFTVSYNANNSNVDSYKYDKITAMLTASAAVGF